MNYPELYKTGRYSDYLIICEDKEFRVHRLVLCKKSKVIKTAMEYPVTEKSFSLDDYRPHIVEYLIKIFYYIKVVPSNDDIDELAKLINYLDVHPSILTDYLVLDNIKFVKGITMFLKYGICQYIYASRRYESGDVSDDIKDDLAKRLTYENVIKITDNVTVRSDLALLCVIINFLRRPDVTNEQQDGVFLSIRDNQLTTEVRRKFIDEKVFRPIIHELLKHW